MQQPLKGIPGVVIVTMKIVKKESNITELLPQDH